jgi:ankyrin repeat protein
LKSILKVSPELINSGDKKFGWTALHEASWKGHEDIVEVLLGAGASVGTQNGYQSTALHVASEYGHPEVVKRLLRWGADPNVTDLWGRIPLHKAASEGHAQIVHILLARGSNGLITDEEGNTAVEVARIKGQQDVIHVFQLWSRLVTALRKALERKRGVELRKMREEGMEGPKLRLIVEKSPGC